jgi:hypothetical protein
MEAESCWNGGLSLTFRDSRDTTVPAYGEQNCVVSLRWLCTAIDQISTVYERSATLEGVAWQNSARNL